MLMTPFLGELLIFVLLTVVNGRVIFTKHSRIDSLVLFSIIALVSSILMLFAWGVNYAEIFVFGICLVTTIMNYRAIIRFFNKLYVDSYSTRFSVVSLILLAVCIASIVTLVLLRPVHLETKKYQVTYSKQNYAGNLNNGYAPDTELFTKRNLVLHTFKPENSSTKPVAVLFIPDKRSSVYYYEPYLMLLAKSGLTVYAADFDYKEFPSDKDRPGILQRFIHERNYLRHREDFLSHLEQYKEYYAREFTALTKVIDQLESPDTKFVIIADGIPALSFDKITSPARTVSQCYSLAAIPEYQTNGFGFIEQTDPLTAKILFGLSRQKTSFTASYAVMQTKKVIARIDSQETETSQPAQTEQTENAADDNN